MSRNELQHVVAESLKIGLADTGFRKYLKSRGELVRPHEGGQDRLGIDLFKWRSEDCWHVTFRLSVRIDTLENLLNRVQPVDVVEQRHTCLISTLIDNLYPKGPGPKEIDRFGWKVRSPEDIDDVAPEMCARIRRYGLPFFERLHSLTAIRDALSTEKGDYPVPLAEQRARGLMVCLALLGEERAQQEWAPTLRGQLLRGQGEDAVRDFDEFLKRLAVEFPVVGRVLG